MLSLSWWDVLGMLLAARCLECCYGQRRKEIAEGNGVMRGIIKRGFDWLARCLSLWHVVLTASSVVQGVSDSWFITSGFLCTRQTGLAMVFFQKSTCASLNTKTMHHAFNVRLDS